MKHTVRLAALAVAALGFSASALADEVKGFYVQGDLGLAHLKVDDGTPYRVRDTFKNVRNSYDESGFMPRISAGYDFGDFRVAGDYTHYKSVSDSVREGNNRLNMKVRASGVGASVMYDIPLQSNFQPYVGARLSVNHIKTEADATVGTLHAAASESSTKVGIGAMAGLGYKINNNLTVDGGYRYNRLTSDLKTHEVSAGVRYTFQ
ncbi:MAG: opacity family porin [Eikenella sp.]|nr:opacity family porin [Eikenella sp.]